MNFDEIPAYPGEGKKEYYNAGCMLEDDFSCETAFDSRLEIIRKTNAGEFAVYCEKLEKEGFIRGFSRDFTGFSARSYTLGETNVYAWFDAYRSEARVVSGPAKYSVDNFGGSGGDDTRGDTAFMQYGLYYSDMIPTVTSDCGMNYVIRLRDNSLVIIDGGECEQCFENATADFMRRLRELTNTGEREKITIAAWLCTHPHNDHMDFLGALIDRYYRYLKLERVIFNFPSHSLSGYDECIRMDKLKIAAFAPGALCLKIHPGQKFSIANAEFDILTTHEDIVGERTDGKYYRGINESTSVVKISFEGKTFIVLGDAEDKNGEVLTGRFGETGLECDWLQAAHHCINRVENIYSFVRAGEVLIPECRYVVRKHHMGNYGVIKEHYGADNIRFAGDYTLIYTIKDREVTGEEVYPVAR